MFYLLPLCLVAQAEWTEAAVLAKFHELSPLARETRAREDAARAETRGRTLYANPVLGFSHEGAGRTDFFQASQTLPFSGRFAFLRRAGDQQASAIAAEGAALQWQARQAVRAAFYRTLAAQERQRAQGDTLAAWDRVIATLRIREQEGESSRLDRLRAERERHEMIAESGLLQAVAARQLGELRAWLPASTAIAIVNGSLAAPTAIPADDDIQAAAVAAREELRALQSRARQAELEQQAAERLRRPEPIVTAGLKRADIGPLTANGPVLSVAVPLPIFNQGKAEVARWSAEQQRTLAQRDTLERRIRAEASAARAALLATLATRDAYNADTAELVRVSMVAYQEGEIGILQLLDAYRLQRQARLRAIDLAAAAKEAQIELELAMGKELAQ
jgi:cobalt-zinc-cadmium efflux system outer membrane protein